MQAAHVVKVATNPMGKEKGRYDPNPILDSRVYEVMFPDGDVEQYAANILAENMLGQVDEHGHRYQLLDSITDHRTDGTESEIQGSYTTRGHELKCDWTDGTASWIPLKDVKESYPIETAEFAVSQVLTSSPAFKWWVPHILKKRDHIISKVRHRLLKKKFKYDHEVPSSVKHAYELDKKHGNNR